MDGPASTTAATVAAAIAGTTIIPQSRASFLEIASAEVELGQEIGRGAFARVHLGRWRGQEVAVKLLDAGLAPHRAASAAEELLRELAIMAALPPHPNVLPLLGAVMAAPVHGNSCGPALVTAFCPGGSLFARLRSPAGATLGMRELLRVCLGAARGVAHLHAHGVLHRDLKPGNVLLDSASEPRLADFGLSRALVAGNADPLTGGLGTHVYMAPEVSAAGQMGLHTSAHAAVAPHRLTSLPVLAPCRSLPASRTPPRPTSSLLAYSCWSA